MKLLLFCVVFVAFTLVSARKKCFYVDEIPEKYKKHEEPEKAEISNLGCFDPMTAGFCRGNFTRYGYNSAKDSCVEFNYGGCGANRNNFKTLVECQTACLSSVEAYQPSCASNEHYDECGSACVAKCNEPAPSACTFNCMAGCFCNDGLVRDDEGSCISPEECPAIIPTCKRHEVYSECDGGPACNPTCTKPTDSFICTSMCTPGCICKEGYVLDSFGECIPHEDCPRNSSSSSSSSEQSE